MKRVIIVLGLWGCTANVAEWSLLGPSEGGETTIYIDKARISRKGDIVEIWELADFSTKQEIITKIVFQSQISRREYDCRNEKMRNRFFSWHSGRKGTGDVVFTEKKPNDKWELVAPGTESVYKFSCGKR